MIICALTWATSAFAQTAIDPSSALLLAPTGQQSSRGERSGVESGRYTVRPRSTSEKAVPEKVSEKPALERSTRKSSESVSTAEAKGNGELSPGVVIAPGRDGTVLVPSVNPSTAQSEKTSSSPEANLRTHLLELSIASSYLFESATSNYSYRNFATSGPGYVADARVWLSPELSIGANYLSSLGGQISSGSGQVSYSRTELSWGIGFRQIFSKSELIVAIEAVETQSRVAAEATDRVRTKTNGVRLRIESLQFDSPSTAWGLSFAAAPKLGHEESAAATDIRSGSSAESYAALAALERRWIFDNSSNSVFVKLQHSVERNIFSGTANRLDPASQLTPQGVGVTDSTTLIQFGYRWRN